MALTSVNRTIHLTNSLICVTKRSELAIADNLHRISNIGIFINKAYRPNAHLLYIVMHYNGSII